MRRAQIYLAEDAVPDRRDHRRRRVGADIGWLLPANVGCTVDCRGAPCRGHRLGGWGGLRGGSVGAGVISGRPVSWCGPRCFGVERRSAVADGGRLELEVTPGGRPGGRGGEEIDTVCCRLAGAISRRRGVGAQQWSGCVNLGQLGGDNIGLSQIAQPVIGGHQRRPERGDQQIGAPVNDPGAGDDQRGGHGPRCAPADLAEPIGTAGDGPRRAHGGISTEVKQDRAGRGGHDLCTLGVGELATTHQHVDVGNTPGRHGPDPRGQGAAPHICGDTNGDGRVGGQQLQHPPVDQRGGSCGVTVEANPAERRQIQPDQPTVLGGAEDHQIHRVLGVGLNAGIHGVPRDTGLAAGGLPRRRQRRFESFDEGHCQFVAAGGDHPGRPWTGGQR